MLAGLIKQVKSKPYETQVVLLVALLAIVRLVIALWIDAQRPEPSTRELLTDVGLLLVFGGLLVLGMYKANFTRVPSAFGFLIVLLLGFSFVELNGVSGTSRFNYYSGIYIVGLLFGGRQLLALLSFQMVLIAILAAGLYFQWPWLQQLVLPIGPDPSDFLFALVALGLLSYYLKSMTLREISKFEEVSEELRLRVAEAKRTNQSLVKQGVALQNAQELLAVEVSRRTEALERQQMAIEAYNRLNTTSLGAPISELGQLIERCGRHDHLCEMLIVSQQELSMVFENIKNNLEETGQVDRTKIRPL